MSVICFLWIFCSILVQLHGSEDQQQPSLEISRYPPSKAKGHQNLILRVEETLNLSCEVTWPQQDALPMPKFSLIWNVPISPQNSNHRVMRTEGYNSLNLVVQNLQESDSGDYTCEARHDDMYVYNSIRLSVKNKKISCSEHYFQCPSGNCIIKRYMCDGRPDCKDGADEALAYCGHKPCSKKLTCDDGRCISFARCCDQYTDPNCTVKEKPSCCSKLQRNSGLDTLYQSDEQRYSDMGFLQKTIYAVVGSAMAFMFVVTVLIIAICRIHLKRTSLSRCPGATTTRVSRYNHHHLPLCDIDLYLNRPMTSPTTEAPGFLVTYNINNGVQFVGRPVNPPPYSEVVSTPPREGPPPPYISHENLPAAVARDEQRETAREEVEERETPEEEEVTEEEEVNRPLRSRNDTSTSNA